MLLAESTLQFALEDLKGFQQTVNISEEQFKAGYIGEGDYLKIKLQLLQFQTDVSSARLAKVQALVGLREFLGYDAVPANFDVIGELAYQPVKTNVEDLQLQALHNRPDYRAAELGITAAKSQIALAKANGKVDVTGTYDFTHVSGENTASIFANFPLPIFDRNQGEIARTKFALTQAQEQKESASDTVLSDVSNAYEAVKSNDEVVQLYTSGYLQQAKDSRDIVMIENIYRELALREGQDYRLNDVILAAARDVDRPIFYSVAVILAGYLPIYALSGPAGKLFHPMAETMSFALVGALILTLTLIPVLASYWFKSGVRERPNRIFEWMKSKYAIQLDWALNRPKTTMVIATVIFGLTLLLIPFIGGEFMPHLDEGALWVRATMPYTISFEEASKIAPQIRDILMSYPQVTVVGSELGRPDDGTDPTGFFNCEFYVGLKPYKDKVWHGDLSDKKELIDSINKKLTTFPGIIFNYPARRRCGRRSPHRPEKFSRRKNLRRRPEHSSRQGHPDQEHSRSRPRIHRSHRGARARTAQSPYRRRSR